MLITTTNQIEGKVVREYKGIVFGEVISGINMFKDIGAGIRNIFGGRSSGYEDELMACRQNALEEILRVLPDLILLDINIPYLNGEVLLQNLRKVSNIPVIMVTSRASEVDEVLSMSYGADDYITKPYNPSILLLQIDAVLRRG